MTKNDVSPEVVTDAAALIFADLANGCDLTEAEAARLLRTNVRFADRNPYQMSTFARPWFYRVARIALRKLVREGKLETFLGAGERRDEVRTYVRKSEHTIGA